MPEKYCLSMSFTHSPALRVTTKVFAGLELRKVKAPSSASSGWGATMSVLPGFLMRLKA